MRAVVRQREIEQFENNRKCFLYDHVKRVCTSLVGDVYMVDILFVRPDGIEAEIGYNVGDYDVEISER
jgi:hypothetical protein